MTASTVNIAAWQTVDARVSDLLPRAFAVKKAHTEAALKSHLFGPAEARWDPTTNQIRLCVDPHAWKAAGDKYRQLLGDQYAVAVITEPADPAREIVVKRASWSFLRNAIGAGMKLPGQAAGATHKILGGPNPLSNALVSGLVAGGLGYGAGALAENLFPERYMERGKLRRTLGLVGGLGGLGLGAGMAAANQNMLGGSYLSNWLVPSDLIERSRAVGKQANFAPPELAGFRENPMIPGTSGMMAPSVDVRRMNDAIWNDARRGFHAGFQQHTNPAYAAAVSGMMTGLSTGLRSPIIRPVDVVRGIASAGVGLATANVAGRALSALAGLTPAAQNTLQDMGLWGGMIHALAPPILGMR